MNRLVVSIETRIVLLGNLIFSKKSIMCVVSLKSYQNMFLDYWLNEVRRLRPSQCDNCTVGLMTGVTGDTKLINLSLFLFGDQGYD